LSSPASKPELAVVVASSAFAAVWPDLAARLGLELRILHEPAPVRETRNVAVILACGGEESRAVDLLHRSHRAGIENPILVGAEADHRLAVELMRRGAAAYYALPGDEVRLEDDLRERVTRLDLPSRARGRPEFERSTYDFSAIVGEDPGLKAALDRAAKVISGGRATVLILGETGTGKELLAQALHYNGPRAGEPFVTVNCSAIPGTMLESELFGHEKGAFTDARAAKPGLFEVADGGTVFLDEVAILAPELQGKLLRFLETREIRRLGGLRSKKVDVRILAAANVDLRELVESGDFREDLYYRLAVIPIELPPLRHRGGDALLLARRFLSQLAEDYDLAVPELTREAVRALEGHAWPGNVRELRNSIERGLLLSAGAPIRPEHLALAETSPDRRGRRESGTQARTGESLPFPASLAELERAAARAMLERCAGNKSEAARRLRITRSRLYRLLGAPID
jgi:DNA-binding NtrC family response regulator